MVEVSEEGQGGGGQAAGVLAEPGVAAAADLNEALDALEHDRAEALIQGVARPVGDELQGDPSVLRIDVRDVLEHGGLDGVEEALDLHGGLLVAERGAGGRTVMTRPQLVAGGVGSERVELLFVAVPVGGVELRQHGQAVAHAAGLDVEGGELVDGQRALVAKQQLGLGDDVVGSALVSQLDLGRVGESGDQLTGLLEGGQELLCGGPLLLVGEGAQRFPAPGVAAGLGQRGHADEVVKRGAQLGPQRGGLLVTVQGEESADALAESEGDALGLGRVLGDRFILDGHALEGGRLTAADRAELARLAQRALIERGQAREVAADAVAPGALAGDAGLLLAVARAIDGAEDVLRELLEVVTVEDELVARVDRPQLTAAAAPEDQVHHDVGAGDEVAAIRGLAREAEGGGEVVT